MTKPQSDLSAIRPGGRYSTNDLFVFFSIPRSQLAAAERRCELLPLSQEFFNEEAFASVYSGADILEVFGGTERINPRPTESAPIAPSSPKRIPPTKKETKMVTPTYTAKQYFDQAITSIMRAEGVDRRKAMARAASQYPRLHFQWLAEENEKAGRTGVAADLRQRALLV